MQVTWYTAMSMDGRIAGEGNDLSFLDTVGRDAGAAGLGFAQFIASIDAVVVGASTMRWLLDGGHGWPHDDIPTWLLTHDAGLRERIGATRAPLHSHQGDVAAVFDAIDGEGHDEVWLCGGGDVAAQALAADRVDRVVATIAPTVLGQGPALFDGDGLPRRAFRLTGMVRSGGAAQLTWVRARLDE